MAAQIDRRRWDRRLARYQRRKALADADHAFGAHHTAMQVGGNARCEVEKEYGSWKRAMAHEGGAAQCEAIYTAESQADETHERDYGRPADNAAILLALTPAPDLEAALYKVDLIKKEELDNHVRMPRDCMAVVIEDMARLAKPGAE